MDGDPDGPAMRRTQRRETMATPKKKSEEGKKPFHRDPNMLYLGGIEGKNEAESKAVFSHSPALRATCAGRPFSNTILPGGDAAQSLKTLRERIKKVQGGDMAGVEATLVAQADTLDAVFNAMLLRAMNNQQNLQHFEGLMRVAMKAQAQCSLTLRTLSEIKNPRQTAFIKQQNNANQQIVNNDLPGAQETGKQPDELLEGGPVERMDAGTEIPAIEAHSRMDAMEEIDRTQERRREESLIEKCMEGRDKSLYPRIGSRIESTKRLSKKPDRMN